MSPNEDTRYEDAAWAIAEPAGAAALWSGLGGLTVDAPSASTARRVRRLLRRAGITEVRVIVVNYPYELSEHA